jgi:hypothetical protein
VGGGPGRGAREVTVGRRVGLAARHGADAGMRFAHGDGVVNIIIVRLNGLVVENERRLFVGHPRSDLQRRAYEAATAANMTALEKFVAGTPVAEVDAVAQRMIEQHGFGDHIMYRTGHGMVPAAGATASKPSKKFELPVYYPST